MVWPLQQCDGVAVQSCTNDEGFSGELGKLEDSEVAEELNDLEPTEAMQVPITEESWGIVDNLGVSEVIEGAALDEILDELDRPENSEAMKVAILEEFLGASEDLGIFEVMEDAMVSDLSGEWDDEEASEATETPIISPIFKSPSKIRGRTFFCPFKDSLECERTFCDLRYAKSHSKVHSHHIRCHLKSCRSRFETQAGLASHLNKVHGLEDIADLDSGFKGPLRGTGGKFLCRFRGLLGCRKTFSQNGHANRHALLHCKRAIPCNVRGCREKFMKRENWEAHFWVSHHEVLD